MDQHGRHRKFELIARDISRREHLPMKSARAILAAAKKRQLAAERKTKKRGGKA